MQNDKTSARPQAPPDTDAPPPSHDHINRPGVTNGVPDQANEAQPTGSPSNERHETETRSGGGSGAGGSGA